MIRVVKRSGRVETLDVSKIQKYTADAVEGLVRVSQSELEVDAKLQFRDMISSEEIQTTLIKTAVDKIDIDRPDWTFVASRLFLYDIYHKATGFTGYQHLREHFIRGEKAGRIVLGLKDKYDLDDLNDYLEPERDLQFTYLGIRTLYDRYLLKDKQGVPIELPQQLFMGVAMFLAQNEFDCQTWAKKFYDILSKFEVMAATPTLSNARTPRHQLSSCFTKGTPVRTINGYKAIDKLELGDMVLTHKNRFMKVYELFERDYAKQLISLDVNGLVDKLEATEEHPILSIKKSDIHKNIDSSWNKINDLNKEDYLSISYPIHIDKKISLDNETMFILGYFIVNGSINKDGHTLFTFSSSQIKYIEEVKNILEKGFSTSSTLKTNGDSTILRFQDDTLSFFIYNLVGDKNSKKLHNDILFANNSLQKSFLKGIQQISQDKLCGKNKKFIQQLFEISLRCKFFPSIFVEEDTYVLTIEDKNTDSFWFKDEYFMKIINKKESYLEDKVYNIEVEVDHSYSVAGVNVHNCYIGSTPDNIEGIFDAFKEMALLSKFGGGIGWDWSLVRGMGSYIDGHKHAAGGIVPFLKIANDVAIAVDQLGCVAKNSYVRISEENSVKTIAINDAKIGDLIECFNIELDKVEYRQIDGVHELEVKQENQIKISFKEGYIVTSKWHPMAIKSTNGYVYKRSDEIEVGEFGVNHKGKADKIIAIDMNPKISEEYMDLTVQGTNNYFASTDKTKNFYLTHNTRKGAIAVYIEPWHVDIRDFLDLKKNSGEERRRAHDLFPALWLNDLFMDRVQKDEMWTLFDPFEVTELTTLYSKDFEERYLELEKNDDEITREVISAKGLWKEILRSYFETGNPFLTFKDTANRANPNKHAGVIRSTNLCVTGDTKVLTKKYGYVKIKKVAGKTLECWNGEEWSDTELFQTSESQKVLKINLSSQQTIEATPYHKWSVVVQNKFGENKGEVIKRTHELEAGDKLSKFELEPIPHGTKSLKLAYENGFYSADGTVVKDNSVIGSKIYLYHEKRNLFNVFSGFKHEHRQDKRISLNYEHGLLKKKFFIPNYKYSVKSRLDWLAGYIDGDGTLTSNEASESIQVASTNTEFLLEIRLMLQELGVYSIVSHFKDAGYRYMPKNDGSGESKEYWCKKQTRLLIAGSSLNMLLSLGYVGYRVKPQKRVYNRSAVRFVKVLSVVDENESKATYCGTEPKRSKMMFDGVMTLQCTEIFQNTNPNTYKTQFTFDDGSVEAYDENEMLTVGNGTTKPAKKITALDTLGGKQIWVVDKEKTDGDTAVCNLASVNLAKIHSREDLERVVPIAIRMLDNVIDLNFYPLAKVKKTNEKSRSIGLGVMGEAQMLAEAKIEWGSNTHFEKIDEVMESFSYYTIEASSNLAIEKGKYPTFEGSDWSKGIFPIDKANANACKLVDRGGLFGYTHDWLGLKEKVKTDGMRNGYLMAIAPTSSISILTGTTQAIEPVYKRKWFEENLSGLIPVVAPNLSADTWQYYTPAYDLDQNLLIKAGAIRQKWLDQGQSLNIFITLDKASGKYLNEIYMNAWKFGLKSTYYLRSQSPESSNDIEDRSQECVGCQ